MTTRARVDRLALRIAAHVPAVVNGLCACPVDRVAVRIDLGAGAQLADPDIDPCPRCGGMPRIVLIDLGADSRIIAARDPAGGMHEITRLGISIDGL